jgi:hypothetical protein
MGGKRDKNFRLSKQTKRFLATIVNVNKRNEYKKSMIEAEIAGSIIVKSKKTKDPSEQ